MESALHYCNMTELTFVNSARTVLNGLLHCSVPTALLLLLLLHLHPAADVMAAYKELNIFQRLDHLHESL